MSDLQSVIAQRVEHVGAAAVARDLGVSRAALVSYLASACRASTRLVIEQRAGRLAPAGGTP
jgi:hypothetical protein